MANYNAIAVISKTIINQLKASAQLVGISDLEFDIYTSQQFTQSPITNGVSLFIYRIFPNGDNRTPIGYLNNSGKKQPRLLPVDIHFLLTIWGGEASMQHTLVGWVMRVMEDNSLLTASALNAVKAKTFRRDETVEIGLAEFKTEDLMRISEVLMPNGYQLSIPYYARVVQIESQLESDEVGGEVQERNLDFTSFKPPSAFMEGGE